MTVENVITLVAALATPVFAFLGIVAQCYFANRSKKGKNEQTEEIKKAIDVASQKAEAAQEEAAAARQVVNEMAERQSANDVVTVAVVRQNIRMMYYELLPHKMISVVDLRALDEMYHAYKAVTLPDGHHPNSWCDALYEEMRQWEKVEIYPEHLKHLNTTKKGK